MFYTGHQVATLPMHYVRSRLPGDIRGGWEPVKHITTNTPGSGWTYANLAQLSAEPNKLYVYWRGGNFNPTFSTTTRPVIVYANFPNDTDHSYRYARWTGT